MEKTRKKSKTHCVNLEAKKKRMKNKRSKTTMSFTR